MEDLYNTLEETISEIRRGDTNISELGHRLFYSDNVFEDGARETLFMRCLKDDLLTIEQLEMFFYYVHEKGDIRKNFSRDDIEYILTKLGCPLQDPAARQESFRERLDDVITVFRGLHIAEGDINCCDLGYSWTTDAEYALRYVNGRGVVLEGRVSKDAVKAFLQGRSEDELFLYPEDVTLIEEKWFKAEDGNTTPDYVKDYSSNTIRWYCEDEENGGFKIHHITMLD